MRTVIVGAGIAGLTIADRILSSNTGETVILFDREASPGGLARSFHIDGYDFDIGPHRFHTSNSEVDSYLLEILADSFIKINRKSCVHLEGRYSAWPLTLASVSRLPFPILWRSFLDLFKKTKIPDAKSFADFIKNRYGENLYNYFFAGYTRKFAGIDAEKLHIDWAEAGVNRAVIDNRFKADSLASLAKGILLPKPFKTQFYYPSYGGIQTFCNLQMKKIKAASGELVTNTGVNGLSVVDNRVSGVILESGEIITADRVFWTAPVTTLYPKTDLDFINTVVANIGLVHRIPENKYQWCYFGNEDLIFSRLTIPRNFRADCVPPGHDSIIAEITCNSSDDIWENPQGMEDKLINDLKKVNAINGNDILFINWQRIPETYPVYTMDYKEKLSSIILPEGLTLAGRCGSFWYNNMDHSIAQSLAVVGNTEYQKDFWNQR